MKTTVDLRTVASNELRKLGMPVTAENVDALIAMARQTKAKAGNSKAVPTPAELKATTEQMLANMKTPEGAAAPVTNAREIVEFAGVDRHGKNAGVVQAERIGPKPPAQQYAQPEDYFAEPRLTDQKRAEYEARANGIRTELNSPGLTPVQTLRLEQELQQIERVLGKTNSGDERRSFAR